MVLGGYVITRRQQATEEMSKAEAERTAAATPPPPPEQVEALLPLDTLELEVGYGLIPLGGRRTGR